MKEPILIARGVLSILSLAVLLPMGAAWAQVPAPNSAGVSMGHLHLNVRDIEVEKKFWTTMGGTYIKTDTFDIMKFPDVLVFLKKGEPSAGSAGSVVNHVGFRVPDGPQALAKWKAAGLTTEAGKNPRGGYVISPDELRIEIVEDPSLTVPIAMHHIHFFVAEAAVPEIKAWYVKTFGAKPGKRGDFEAADIPGVNLTFSPSPTPTEPTKGRALDHIGFEVKDLEAFLKKLEASGIKLDRPYTKTPTGLAISFLTDRWGTYIELTEGLNKF